jgi:hypothetical protein
MNGEDGAVGIIIGTVLIVSLSIIAILWMLKPFERKRLKSKRGLQEQNPFAATSILAEDCACEAVKVRGSNRYLVAEALPIPLPECTSPKCECTYVHHGDRRDGIRDRRAKISLNADGNAWGRRGSQGRRKSDWRTAA